MELEGGRRRPKNVTLDEVRYDGVYAVDVGLVGSSDGRLSKSKHSVVPIAKQEDTLGLRPSVPL